MVEGRHLVKILKAEATQQGFGDCIGNINRGVTFVKGGFKVVVVFKSVRGYHAEMQAAWVGDNHDADVTKLNNLVTFLGTCPEGRGKVAWKKWLGMFPMKEASSEEIIWAIT